MILKTIYIYIYCFYYYIYIYFFTVNYNIVILYVLRDLDNNDIETLPDTIGNLKNLEALYVLFFFSYFVSHFDFYL